MGGKTFGVLFASLIAMAAALTIALFPGRPLTIGTPYEAFKSRWKSWLSKRPANYAVDIDKTCFCHPWSVRIEV